MNTENDEMTDLETANEEPDWLAEQVHLLDIEEGFAR